MSSLTTRSGRFPQFLSLALSTLSFAMAVLVFVGWEFNIPALRSFGDYTTFMAPNSAALIVFASLAITLAQPAFRHWSTVTLSYIFSAIVFLGGFLTALQYPFKTSFGIDQLLFRSYLADWTVTPTPGRISLQASVGFALVGAALLLLDRRFLRVRFTEVFSGLALGLSFLGVVGHLYGVRSLYGVMAIHTACAILLLSTAILLCRPDRGFAGLFFGRSAAGVALRRTLLTTVVALTIFGWVTLKLENRYGITHETTASILVLLSVLFVCLLLIRTSYALQAMERDSESTRRALFESESRYRSLFQNTKEGIALYEPILDDSGQPTDWLIRDVNPTFLSGSGIDRADLVGRRLTDVFGGREALKTYFEAAREVFNSGRARQFEAYLGPLRRYFIVSIFPIAERLYASTAIDITKSRQAELQVRESEARYRQIVETANEGIWMLDNDMRVTFVNDRLAQMLGYLSQEMVGKRKFDFVFSEDASFVQGLFDARRQGLRAHVDLRMRHKNGSERWMMMAAAPVVDREGKFMGALDMFTDVTDRRATIQALRESEERFRQLADSMPQIVWTAIPEGWMDYCNRRWIEYTGTVPTDSKGWNWTAAVHPDDLAQVLEGWNHALATAQAFSAEARLLRHSDATYRWHLTRAIPAFDAHGKVACWYGTSTDIHENKLAEEAMMKSEKLAATGRLAATIAHEINNPLEAVTNLIFLAQNSGAGEQSKQFLQLASEELQRVAHITKQTLGFYRETAAPGEVRIDTTIDNVLTLYERKIESKDIQIVRSAFDDTAIEAIPGEIRQVLSNLISNAIDALEQRGVLRLAVRALRHSDQSLRGVRIIVSDNGSGIPEEIRQQVFEPFFTTKRDFGTGLGLWVTRQIIRRHGGTIHVRSCTHGKHRGTYFSIYLPARPAIQELDARAKAVRVEI
jgi:PAS domain S-box-containing protein